MASLERVVLPLMSGREAAASFVCRAGAAVGARSERSGLE